MTGTAIAQTPAKGAKSAAISNLMVGLLSRYTGRGPTQARTHFSDNLVTIVLGETLTKAEHTLVANDHSDVVLSTRKTFQDVMGAELIAGVENILQRKVVAFLSANHIDPDIAVETFILAPADGDAEATPPDSARE